MTANLRNILLIVLVISCFTNIKARQLDDTTDIDQVNQTKAVFEDNLDSLLNSYYLQQSNVDNDLAVDTAAESIEYSNIPDSVYAERLARIPTAIKMTYNPIVRKYIEMYSQRKKDRVQVMLGLSEYYFPIFDDIFDYYGLPNELKYMSIIESALNCRARSRTRAIGLWQFMYGTGKLYGLTINSLVDERRDPIKETHAAAKFSKDLFNVFGDWQLVIAAYNCGPGNVKKAIRRSGGKRDFWEIYKFLPRETRGHVPAFIAATYVMNYYKEHNLKSVKSDFPRVTDTIVIHDDLHLMQVSCVLGVPMEQLRDLNPQYIRDIIPAKGTSMVITIPADYTNKFIDYQDSIFAYKDSIFFNPKELNKNPNFEARYYGTAPKGYVKIKHVVKEGETLGAISEKYRCRVNDIMDWNGLYSSRIREGRKLTIYVPKKQSKQYLSDNSKAENENKVSETSKNQNGQIVYYTVKQGDTLWEIAQRYPGTSYSDILKWNGLSRNSSIVPGQQLKIKVM
jgi:membrane-bound lytic murein transglycosylase D